MYRHALNYFRFEKSQNKANLEHAKIASLLIIDVTISGQYLLLGLKYTNGSVYFFWTMFLPADCFSCNKLVKSKPTQFVVLRKNRLFRTWLFWLENVISNLLDTRNLHILRLIAQNGRKFALHGPPTPTINKYLPGWDIAGLGNTWKNVTDWLPNGRLVLVCLTIS